LNILIDRGRGPVYTIYRFVVLRTNVGRRDYMSVVRTDRSCLQRGTSGFSHASLTEPQVVVCPTSRGGSTFTPRTTSMTTITRSYRTYGEDQHYHYRRCAMGYTNPLLSQSRWYGDRGTQGYFPRLSEVGAVAIDGITMPRLSRAPRAVLGLHACPMSSLRGFYHIDSSCLSATT